MSDKFYTMLSRDKGCLESLGGLEEMHKIAASGVEVEQISPHGLYGHIIHNSVERGIPLSLSMNLLGVRSGPTLGQKTSGAISGMNGLISGPRSGFLTTGGLWNPLSPTFEGHIGSTIDALVLFEACMSGPVPRT